MQAWVMARGSGGYDRLVAARKRALLSNLHGLVVEIGPGTGPNLPYFAPDVRWTGLEPNLHMHPYLRKEAARLGREIEIRSVGAPHLDFDDNSVDAVVSTLVLCSVPNLPRTLAEILRVLKPGGRLVFIEHVAAPRGTLGRALQEIVEPVWKVVADGCHPDRETWAAIERAGFSSVRYDRFDMHVPVVGPHIAGVAVK